VSYDNKMQLFSELIDKLNESLSTENASIDRITSRIDQTPILEVKQRLKLRLKETNIQKSRLRRIIIRLGGKPTNAKADLSLSFVSTTMPMGNNFPKKVKSKKEDIGPEDSIREEYELVQVRRDFALKHNELVAYDSLIRRMQMMDMPRKHENISLLEKYAGRRINGILVQNSYAIDTRQPVAEYDSYFNKTWSKLSS
jgi:Domain of unknown function (DUF892)